MNWCSATPGLHQTRHGTPEGGLTGHGHQLRDALRFLRRDAGDLPLDEFCPRTPRCVRQAMAESGRYGRNVVNPCIGFMVRACKWAVAEEMIPAGVYDALRALEPLKAGETLGLRESASIRPVPDAIIDGTLPHLLTPVRGIVELMRWTGARFLRAAATQREGAECE